MRIAKGHYRDIQMGEMVPRGAAHGRGGGGGGILFSPQGGACYLFPVVWGWGRKGRGGLRGESFQSWQLVVNLEGLASCVNCIS